MQTGVTALMLASEGGHLDVVKELLQVQADVNVQNEVCSFQFRVCDTMVGRNLRNSLTVLKRCMNTLNTPSQL